VKSLVGWPAYPPVYYSIKKPPEGGKAWFAIARIQKAHPLMLPVAG